MSLVSFYYADVTSTSIVRKKDIKAFVAYIFESEQKLLKKIGYVFCSDAFLLKINLDFLQHNNLTDIITFDLSKNEAIVGEIYISIDRVKENARAYNTTFRKELLRVVFHGALHLCGYKDKKKGEITIMRQKEDYYLRLYEKNI